MNAATIIRFPPLVDMREQKPAPPIDHAAVDREWEARWREGVARRIARKVYDMPVPAFLRPQA